MLPRPPADSWSEHTNVDRLDERGPLALARRLGLDAERIRAELRAGWCTRVTRDAAACARAAPQRHRPSSPMASDTPERSTPGTLIAAVERRPHAG
jgi:hypothetical protein